MPEKINYLQNFRFTIFYISNKAIINLIIAIRRIPINAINTKTLINRAFGFFLSLHIIYIIPDIRKDIIVPISKKNIIASSFIRRTYLIFNIYYPSSVI
jgi:hypothetical protein